MLEQIVLNSGTFGSKEFRYVLTNSQGTGGKVFRALKKIFPNKEVLKDKYCSLNDNRPTIQLLMYHWYYTVKNNKKSIGMFVKETTNSKASNAQLRRFVNMINEK